MTLGLTGLYAGLAIGVGLYPEFGLFSILFVFVSLSVRLMEPQMLRDVYTPQTQSDLQEHIMLG